jgi:hypothetical protein
MGEREVGVFEVTDWCILRTAGRSTLPLAESLSNAGYRAWTPVEILDAATAPRPAAMTPTYVFAGLDHLLDLLALSDARDQSHEGFSVMRRPGGFAMVRDTKLAGLREEEYDRRPKPKLNPKRRHRIADRFDVGEEVIAPASSGGFVGLQGKVEASDGRYTDLYFGGSMRLKIETFKLRGDAVTEAELIAA